VPALCGLGLFRWRALDARRWCERVSDGRPSPVFLRLGIRERV